MPYGKFHYRSIFWMILYILVKRVGNEVFFSSIFSFKWKPVLYILQCPSSVFLSYFRIAENTHRSISNTSLDDLPVKGPQGPHLSNADVTLVNCNNSENTLIVHPEFLHLKLQAAGLSWLEYMLCNNCWCQTMHDSFSCVPVLP